MLNLLGSCLAPEGLCKVIEGVGVDCGNETVGDITGQIIRVESAEVGDETGDTVEIGVMGEVV